MNSDYAYLCTVYPDEIVYCDTDRICMFGINLILTRFIQYGHKWKFKEHSYITWYNLWEEKKFKWKERKKKERKGPINRNLENKSDKGEYAIFKLWIQIQLYSLGPKWKHSLHHMIWLLLVSSLNFFWLIFFLGFFLVNGHIHSLWFFIFFLSFLFSLKFSSLLRSYIMWYKNVLWIFICAHTEWI